VGWVYCLDTSAYCHFRRGHAPVVERIDGAAWIAVLTYDSHFSAIERVGAVVLQA
jgi:hypothetical protein